MTLTTPYHLASRFLGLSEVVGAVHNPQIMAMLRLDASWPQADEVPWCSAFVNYIAWLLELPRSKSLRARSWLNVGRVIDFADCQIDSDIIILKRGGENQPGPEVIAAPGHVGFYAGMANGKVQILGGNQGNQVSIAPYPIERILGIRRLES